MKIFKQLVFSLAFILSISLAAHAQTPLSPEKQKLIGEMIVLTKVDKQLESSIDLMLELYQSSFHSSIKSTVAKAELPQAEKDELEKRLLADQSNFIAKFRERFHKEISAKLYVEETMYPLYGKFFTESELMDLVAFYKSTTGQKLIDQMPNLLAESFKLTEEKLLPRIQKIAEEIVEEQIKTLRLPQTAATENN